MMAADPTLPGEFELIARYFAPLAAGNAGALGLKDDAGLVTPSPGCTQVVTTDTLVEGVHFLTADPARTVARKLLRVNLSDLAAMGARPLCYLLALSLSETAEAGWVEDFAAGLGADQQGFGVVLVGGDTTATPGPTNLTLTALGEVPSGEELRRSTARIGDSVYVSGTIGDAALGLRSLQGGLAGLAEAAAAALAERYRLPIPRVSLGSALRRLASAAIDVSDGLIADIGHVCEASGVAARLERARLPLSDAAAMAVAADPASFDLVLAGGDDYELAFTARPEGLA